jgi:hypothetical protein
MSAIELNNEGFHNDEHAKSALPSRSSAASAKTHTIGDKLN